MWEPKGEGYKVTQGVCVRRIQRIRIRGGIEFFCRVGALLQWSLGVVLFVCIIISFLWWRVGSGPVFLAVQKY